VKQERDSSRHSPEKLPSESREAEGKTETTGYQKKGGGRTFGSTREQKGKGGGETGVVKNRKFFWQPTRRGRGIKDLGEKKTQRT